MTFNKQRGFTLIELLVVIAIIGILAALVLVALGSARDKANDARIKSNVGQMRTIAEVIYDANDSSYETGTAGVESCVKASTRSSTECTSAELAESVDALASDTDSASDGSGLTAEATSSSFCVEAELNSGDFVCKDDSGQTVESSTSLCTDAAVDCDSAT